MRGEEKEVSRKTWNNNKALVRQVAIPPMLEICYTCLTILIDDSSDDTYRELKRHFNFLTSLAALEFYQAALPDRGLTLTGTAF